MTVLRKLPAEVVSSILAATTAFIGGTALHLPPWAIFIGWAGTYLAGGARRSVLRSMWVSMPVGSTFALVIVLIDQQIGTALGPSQFAQDLVLALIILVVNTGLMYAGRTRLLHLVPAMFLGFASYFATFYGGFGWAPGNAWAAWISVIAMNALGPLFAVIATATPGDHSAPADQSAGVDSTGSTRAQGANVSAAA
jgi:hypothetical protein